MEANPTYTWLRSAIQTQACPVDIKVEPSLEPSAFFFLSPPSSPPFVRSAPTDSAASPLSFHTRRRRSSISLASSTRVRPYPSLKRELYHPVKDTGTMANTWSPPGTKGRPHFPVEQVTSSRRPSNNEQQVSSSYGLPSTFAAVSQISHAYS